MIVMLQFSAHCKVTCCALPLTSGDTAVFGFCSCLLFFRVCLVFAIQSGEQSAMRKVFLLLYTGAASFGFSIFKWILMGMDYG